MLIATNKEHTVELVDVSQHPQSTLPGSRRTTQERSLSASGLIASNHRTNLVSSPLFRQCVLIALARAQLANTVLYFDQIVRFVYFLNAAVVLIGLGIITVAQKQGRFRCNTVTVLFSEEIWQDAHVLLDDGSIEDRLLIYSYFNGNYKGGHRMFLLAMFLEMKLAHTQYLCTILEQGSFNGYPRFVEQNKNDGTSFGESVIPAEIIYCDSIGSWVLAHPRILTSPDGERENECSWLWRSPKTEDYEITSASDSAWDVWVGEVKPLAFVSLSCNECLERSDCNYHGSCKDSVCYCDDTHFGQSCQFEQPCPFLATEKAQRFSKCSDWPFYLCLLV